MSAKRKTSRVIYKKTEMYKDLFNNLTDLVWIAEKNGRFTYVNKAVKGYLGHTREEFTALSLEDIIPSETGGVPREVLLAILTGDTVEDTIRIPVRRKDDELRHLDITLYHDRDEGTGEVQRTIAMGRDITDRQQMADELQASEKLYRDLADISLTGIFVHRNGELLYVNGRLLEMGGYTDEKEFMSKSVLEHVHPDDIETVVERMRARMIGEDAPAEYVVRFLKKSGEVTHGRLNAVRIDYEGQPAILCNIMDISELLRLQQEKILSERLATAGRILGRIAHEVSNFLSPILGYTELLIKGNDAPAEDPTHAYLNSMRICGDRLAEVNNDILALGRRLHFHVEPLKVNDVLDEEIRELELLKNEGVEIRPELDTEIHSVMGDRRQLARAFSNILNNSHEAVGTSGCIIVKTDDVSYVPQGEDDPVPAGNYVVVTVSDDGSGIEADVKERIFEPFFSTKSMEERRGSGLGLSVVAAVIKDHEGFIKVASRPGDGARFEVFLQQAEDS